jgi:hypothetical protein
MKKGAKKSRLNFFWLKMGFATRSQPEPLPDVKSGQALRRSLIALVALPQSHFLNAKTN